MHSFLTNLLIDFIAMHAWPKIRQQITKSELFNHHLHHSRFKLCQLVILIPLFSMTLPQVCNVHLFHHNGDMLYLSPYTTFHILELEQHRNLLLHATSGPASMQMYVGGHAPALNINEQRFTVTQLHHILHSQLQMEDSTLFVLTLWDHFHHHMDSLIFSPVLTASLDGLKPYPSKTSHQNRCTSTAIWMDLSLWCPIHDRN